MQKKITLDEETGNVVILPSLCKMLPTLEILILHFYPDMENIPIKRKRLALWTCYNDPEHDLDIAINNVILTNLVYTSLNILVNKEAIRCPVDFFNTTVVHDLDIAINKNY